MERPEPFVDAVHANVTNSPAAVLLGDHAGHDDERGCSCECRAKALRLTKVVGQRLAEKPSGSDDVIGVP